MGEERRQRAGQIFRSLEETYGTEPWNWHTRQSPFRVLIATVLSQRTRDEKTDEAAKALFSTYSSPRRIANAPLEILEEIIRPVNYYKTKAKRVKEICRMLVERYSGEVPATVGELMKLPGVGRKTANCVMIYGFRRSAIAVDTHVHRIANRTGIIHTKTPEESERELWKIVPEEYVLFVNEFLVKHGQKICKPGNPLCYICPIIDLCDYEPKNLKSDNSDKE